MHLLSSSIAQSNVIAVVLYAATKFLFYELDLVPPFIIVLQLLFLDNLIVVQISCVL